MNLYVTICVLYNILSYSYIASTMPSWTSDMECICYSVKHIFHFNEYFL